VKTDYYIDRVSKSEAAELLLRFHYLKDFSKGFKSGYNYGLYESNDFSPLMKPNEQNIISLLGLFQERLDSYGRILKLKQSSLTLIVIFILVQSIALVTLSIADSQTQRKISTMQTELNTLEAKLKVLQENGKNAPANTDM